MEITMIYYLIPALLMFCCGVYGFVTRKNMIAMLISLELMLNAVENNVFRAARNVDVNDLNKMKH